MTKIGRKVNGYLQRYTVEGDGTFPFDMLRYDQAWVKKECDIYKLSEQYTGKRSVPLLRFSFNGAGPNKARWKSFLWRVVDCEER